MASTIDLVFLGTGSCYPSPVRGASSIILRVDGECLMFDCGEGTQIQYQKSNVKPGKLSKIFITHLHGDHLFGLPGLMCLAQGSAYNDENPDPLYLYGPVGLARYVRESLKLSGTELCKPYKVFEIDIESTGAEVKECDVKHINELDSEIITLSNGTAKLLEGSKYSISVGILKHKLPCVGYVLEEHASPGSLNTELLMQLGLKPGPQYGALKSGKSIRLPDGSLVTPDMVTGKEKAGRKVVILGDTCDNTQIEALCLNADIIIHEATHQDELKEKAITYGHSTPSMAAEFCKRTNAKQLILTHFSQRYHDSEETCKTEDDVTTQFLVEQAIQSKFENVLAARDFLCLPVTRKS